MNEQEILKFWEENKIFKKSISYKPKAKSYIFYDGPPFATGLPHYGHILASIIKDVIPRYQTMKGKKVPRKWGWDCHGLPIENLIEQELNLKTKKDIEKYGVENFNKKAKESVLRYADEWKKIIPRIGRWVDMENDYKTMDWKYTESVWWVFKALYDKGLIYEGRKPMHICPRCETTLSNFEVTQNYQEIKDLGVTVKFELLETPSVDKETLGVDKKTYVLAWTTTAWTLPGNVALAINPKVIYCKIKNQKSNLKNKEFYILAKDRLEIVKDDYEIVSEFKGKDLVGKKYKPLFPYYINSGKICAGDFVSTEEGTGIVHIAPAFGEEDMELAKIEKLPFIQHVDMEGKFKPEVKDFAGLKVKPKGNPRETDEKIANFLEKENKLFAKELVSHSYPFCWRCETPLLNYAANSWFVNVLKIKDKLLENNKKINWVPKHLQEGRFGKWLEGARDWVISRSRYWGAPIPVWRCQTGKSQIPNPKSPVRLRMDEVQAGGQTNSKIQIPKFSKCDNIKIIGSIEELEKLSGEKVSDLHRPYIDKVEFDCACGGKMKRVPEVFDCWFESGSMPYGQSHYPFELKEEFKKDFPAEFIAEGVDQTRGWFYTLLVLSTALFDEPAYKNVVANGIILAEDGQKMSKRLKNYPDPMDIVEKYGADSLRYYLLSSPAVRAESLNFSEKGVDEVNKKVIMRLKNVLAFYKMYAGEARVTRYALRVTNILDKWILARLNVLINEITKAMNNYELDKAARPIADFVDDLSTWYVRRSRERFKNEGQDKENAVETLRYVLIELSKLIAPFMPFVAEMIYQESVVSNQSSVTRKESVHLEEWPEAGPVDTDLLAAMSLVRSFASMALMQRAEHIPNIKVRQPLSLSFVNEEYIKLHIKHSVEKIPYWDEVKNILADEINVKEVVLDATMTQDDPPIKLDFNITPELKNEGNLRELIRGIQDLRKKKGFVPSDKIKEIIFTDEKGRNLVNLYMKDVQKGTGAISIEFSENNGEELSINELKFKIEIKK